MGSAIDDYIRGQLAEGFERRLWSEDAVTPWAHDWQHPSGFVFFDLPERTPVDDLRAAGFEHTGWPDDMPKPFEVNAISYLAPVSTQVLVDAGMEPPEGWEPWKPPPIPWHRRVRIKIRSSIQRGRVLLANWLVGYDVEDRD